MTTAELAILSIGLITAVGADAPSSCAAFRAKLSNPTATRFMSDAGEWILAHQVALDEPLRDLERHAAMATIAIDEAMDGVARAAWANVPLLLCVAETERPGRLDSLDPQLLAAIESRLSVRFAKDSAVIPNGRISVATALAYAHERLAARADARTLIVAVDSLIYWSTLQHYDRRRRLLTSENSNGFMPGEGAGALLVGPASNADALVCTGLGFAVEASVIEGDEPLRGEGMTRAVRQAAERSGIAVEAFDYRIADVSGEHYYFKEAALAMARSVERPKVEFDLWHPAESTGEAGALAGVSIIALADAASRKGYGRGARILAQMSNDDGRRAALGLMFRGA